MFKERIMKIRGLMFGKEETQTNVKENSGWVATTAHTFQRHL